MWENTVTEVFGYEGFPEEENTGESKEESYIDGKRLPRVRTVPP